MMLCSCPRSAPCFASCRTSQLCSKSPDSELVEGPPDRQRTEWGIGQGPTQAESTRDPKGGDRWAWAPDLSSPLILIPLFFRMERAAGEQGRDLWGQPGPWQLLLGLLLSGERAW